MEEANINYEALFDVLRRERHQNELQELDQNFFSDLKNYLAEKKASLESAAPGEFERLSNQYNNIKKLVRELYDRREKKIALLAMTSVKTQADLVETRNLLPEERPLFDSLVEVFRRFRQDLLFSLINQFVSSGSFSSGSSASFTSSVSSSSISSSASASSTSSSSSPSSVSSSPVSSSSVDDKIDDESNEGADKGKVRVRFVSALPRFAGEDGEVFGPFSPGDEASLPLNIAEVLLKKGRAERV